MDQNTPRSSPTNAQVTTALLEEEHINLNQSESSSDGENDNDFSPPPNYFAQKPYRTMSPLDTGQSQPQTFWEKFARKKPSIAVNSASLGSFDEALGRHSQDPGLICGGNTPFHHVPTAYLSFGFLLLLGIFVGLTGAGIDIAISYLKIAHLKFAALAGTDNLGVHFAMYTCFIAALLLTSSVVIQFIGPNAKGIPEMKCILSGVWLHKYLATNVLVAKVIGIILSCGCGAIIGKEGPLVHVASIIEDQATKRIGFFNKLRRNPAMMQQMLAAACAIGVAANFGTPFGGILFSIEVTSTYYPLRNYYFSFVTALSGSFTFLAMWNVFQQQNFGLAFFAISLSCNRSGPTPITLAFSAIVGILGGLIGVIIIKGFAGLMWIHKKGSHLLFFNPFIYTLLVAVTTGALTFPGFVGKIISMPLNDATRIFFDCDTNFNNATAWGEHSRWFPFQLQVFLFLVSKVFLQVITLPIPVPLGVMTPSLALGASMGYLVGSFAAMIPVENPVSPSMMAMAGAASVACGVTHTLSSAIIIVELTGEFAILFPAMVSVLCALVVSRQITNDFFVAVMKLRKLPFLPDLQVRTNRIKAADIMDTTYPSISFRSHKDEIEAAAKFCSNVLKSNPDDQVIIPLSDENRLFIGIVTSDVVLPLARRLYTMTQDDVAKALNEASKRAAVPFTFSKHASFEQVHSSFITMRLPIAFVTESAQVIGTITRQRVMETASQNEDK